MTDYRQLEERFSTDLGLHRRPVAVTSMNALPPNIAKFAGTVPSGCSFWRLASEGRTFYTVPSDHYNCAVGAYTHNISLPPDREHELPATLSFMTGLGYIRMEEVPGIPRLPATPVAVVYAPLGETPVAPRRRDLLRTCGRGDAAAGVGDPGRSGRQNQHAGPTDLYGSAGGDGDGNGGEYRVCREPRLHGHRARRAVCDHPRQVPRADCRRDGRDQKGESRAPGVPHRTARAADVFLDRGVRRGPGSVACGGRVPRAASRGAP